MGIAWGGLGSGAAALGNSAKSSNNTKHIV